MTSTAPKPLTTEVPRDRWGRPLLVPPGGGARQPYMRTTTFVKATDSQFGLIAWKQRQTVLGMGRRPDLVVAAAAARPDDKKALDAIAEKALEHAGSSAAATVGTALHLMAEKVDLGEELGDVPVDAAADIKAYTAATAGLEVLAVEQFRAFDDWRVAGTADRIVRIDGRNYIADIKTGRIDYPHSIAQQLAMYAHSVPYSIETDERQPQTEQLDLKRALIIHLPAGSGTCSLHWVDIEAGWKACAIAKQVHDWRAVKGLTWDTGLDIPMPSIVEQIAWAELVTMAHDVEALRSLWLQAVDLGADDADLLALCRARKAELEG